jgi:hypothetical protein
MTMSNHNEDNTPPAHIKPPPRMPVSEWDKYEYDKATRTKKGRIATAQNKTEPK